MCLGGGSVSQVTVVVKTLSTAGKFCEITLIFLFAFYIAVNCPRFLKRYLIFGNSNVDSGSVPCLPQVRISVDETKMASEVFFVPLKVFDPFTTAVM